MAWRETSIGRTVGRPAGPARRAGRWTLAGDPDVLDQPAGLGIYAAGMGIAPG
jgi:hypothetical protein